VLSQGERQRVLIGRALMAKPRLLILDEPCAGLDPAAREHFLQFLQRLGRRKSSPALVLVTHHVEEIMPVFSHVLVLKAGRVLAAGEKANALTPGLLSQAFDARVRLQRSDGRYSLKVAPKRSVVI
jgi:iron complex transport system ATP-binding protein